MRKELLDTSGNPHGGLWKMQSWARAEQANNIIGRVSGSRDLGFNSCFFPTHPPGFLDVILHVWGLEAEN